MMPSIKENEIDEIIKSLGQDFTLEKFMRKAFEVHFYWENIRCDVFELICLFTDKGRVARLIVISEDPDSYHSMQGWLETYKSDIKNNLLDFLGQSIHFCASSFD